ncbi:hypothetical protein MAR_020270 [Mya arenaria]|uniref:C2H2-type domain-containing protein n=1 Tax=Mya arenaria TaxID=6604 RepID=A0ABY7ECM1_MYAAR|nr:hypothetical protein MAR_020270 [Mya arenaria]
MSDMAGVLKEVVSELRVLKEAQRAHVPTEAHNSRERYRPMIGPEPEVAAHEYRWRADANNSHNNRRGEVVSPEHMRANHMDDDYGIERPDRQMARYIGGQNGRCGKAVNIIHRTIKTQSCLQLIQTDMSAVSRVQYRCRRCDKVGRRYQVVAHILKAHVPIERVPFFCTRCFFRCQDRDTLWNHTERYRGHINEVKKNGPTGELKDILRASTNPWYVTDKDMVMIDCEVPSPQVVGFDEDPFQNNDGQDHTLTAPSPKGPPPPKVSSLSSFRPALQPFGNVPEFRAVPLKDYLASKIPAQKIPKVQIHSGQNSVHAFSSVVQQPYDVAGHGLTYTDLESVSMFDIGPNVRQVAQSGQRNQMPSTEVGHFMENSFPAFQTAGDIPRNPIFEQRETRTPSYERKRKAVDIAPTPCLDEKLTELDLVMPVLQDLTGPLFLGKTPKC